MPDDNSDCVVYRTGVGGDMKRLLEHIDFILLAKLVGYPDRVGLQYETNAGNHEDSGVLEPNGDKLHFEFQNFPYVIVMELKEIKK